MKLNVELFMETLGYMGTGMVGIFAVTGVIILSIFLLNKLGNAAQQKEQ